MPTAKKLPSGSWRCQVFSHYEEVTQSDGSMKKKRIYKSFTCDDPSKAGKKKSELAATTYAADKHNTCASALTVRQAVNKYINSKMDILSPSTLRAYRGIERIYFENIGAYPLSELSNEKIQIWIGEISTGRTSKTVRNAHALLSSAINMFYPEFKVKTQLPQREKPKLYIPTDHDISKLLEHVKGKELELAIYLAAFGPMRRGEICALTREDVNGNIITVNKSMVLKPDNTWEIKQPKTYASYRSIEYPDFVISLLKGKTGRIIASTPSQLTNHFRDAVKYSKLPHFRFHDLRHYSASIMHAMGIPDVYIMQRGGWTTDNVMKTVYRHALDDKTKEMNKKANLYFDSFSMQHEMQHETKKAL